MIFFSTILDRIIIIKKFFFPTAYDKLQKNTTQEQISFYSQFISKRDLVFDIGANVGFKTNVFLELNAKVVSVEPQPSCVRGLKKKFGNKIIIEQVGLGKEESIKDFYISNNNQLSSFDKTWVEDLKNTRFSDTIVKEILPTKITTLDVLISKYGTPKFIKIDVEGFEEDVLKGLSQKFNYISFEYAVPEKHSALVNCLQLLNNKYENLGYNIAIGNTSALHFKDWKNAMQMQTYVNSSEFKNSFAGDVYVRHL